MQNATSQDFIFWTKKAKTLSECSLRYVIKDCQEAARAMASHPQPNKENYYIDQGLTFADELNRSNNKGK
jgi:hypothetical protein